MILNTLKIIVLSVFLIVASTHVFAKKSADNNANAAEKAFLTAGLYFDHGNYNLALNGFLITKPIFEKLKNWNRLYYINSNLALSYAMLNDSLSANRYLLKAQAILKVHFLNNPKFWSNFFNCKAYIYQRFYRYDEATAIFEQLLVSKKYIDSDSGRISKFYYVGRNYYQSGNYFKSKQYYLSAYNLVRKDPVKFIRIKPYILTALGLINMNEGNWVSAKLLFNDALKLLISEKEKKIGELVTIHICLGNIAKEQGEYENAIAQFNNALFFINDAGEKFTNLRNNANSNIAEVYIYTRNYKHAIEVLKNIVDEDKLFQSDKPAYYKNLANCYHKLGNNKEAAKNFERSIAYRKKYFSDSHPELGKVYMHFGKFLMETDKMGEAQEMFVKAKDIFCQKFGKKNLALAQLYIYIAAWNEKQNQYDAALCYYDSAMSATIADGKNIFRYSIPGKSKLFAPLQLLEALKGKAHVWDTISYFNNPIINKQRALAAYQLASALIAHLRGTYLMEESKLYITENEIKIYSHIIALCYDLGQLTHNSQYDKLAFEYAEKGRAATLLQNINEQEAINNSDLPSFAVRVLAALQEKIQGYEACINYTDQRTSSDSTEVSEIKNKLLDTYLLKEKVTDWLKIRYPGFGSNQHLQKVCKINQMQTKLKASEAFIEYHLADSFLYAIVIRENNYHLIKIAADNSLPEQLAQYRQLLAEPDIAHASFNEFNNFCTHSYFLYKELLTPLLPYIKNVNNITIVTDENIGTIPFETLISELPQKNQSAYCSLHYLLFDYTIHYAYSASLYLQNKQRIPLMYPKVNVFAPLYNKTSTTNCGNTLIERYKLLPLTWTEGEANGIKSLFKATTFIGTEATEMAYKTSAQKSDIVHLAMHSFLDTVQYKFSSLVFAGSCDTANDGLLNTSELQNVKLNAQLVVLSACNTGYGKQARGEGVMSMMRGFIQAGCPSVVSTLWTVNDAESASLTLDFYKEISYGKPLDEALQRAKINYLKHADALTSHPFFWSGFTLYGQSQAVASAPPDIKLWMIFLVAIILIAVLLAWKK